jgi:hypothetical protein
MISKIILLQLPINVTDLEVTEMRLTLLALSIEESLKATKACEIRPYDGG